MWPLVHYWVVLCDHILCKVVNGSEWLLNCLQLLDWCINIFPSYVSKFKFLRRREGGKEGGGSLDTVISAISVHVFHSFI